MLVAVELQAEAPGPPGEAGALKATAAQVEYGIHLRLREVCLHDPAPQPRLPRRVCAFPQQVIRLAQIHDPAHVFALR